MWHHGAPAEGARTQTGAPRRSQRMPIGARFGCPDDVATGGGLLIEGLGNRFWDSQGLDQKFDPAPFPLLVPVVWRDPLPVCRFLRMKFHYLEFEIQLVQPGSDQKI